ncbi:hypothetical protein ACTXT7_014964 [Hymenolepis weldensis]
MGNRLVCCRLSWTSFTNSEDDIPSSGYQSRFQFTNHGAYFPPIVTTLQQPSNVFDDTYQHLLSYCQKAPNSQILEASVQHISEREPEDLDFNPSLDASNTTLFLHSILWSISQSSPLQKMLSIANKERKKHEKKRTMQRWSSCGTVYIGEGCLSKPESKLILHCISVAICSLIKTERVVKNPKQFKSTFSSDQDPLIGYNSSVQSPSLSSTYDMGNECSIPSDIYKEVYEIYDERPISSYCQLDSHFSSNDYPYAELRFQHQILYFLNRLFSSSLLTPESAIVSLKLPKPIKRNDNVYLILGERYPGAVPMRSSYSTDHLDGLATHIHITECAPMVYLERLISSLEMYVVAWSWRRQLLACILIASKVLDDQAVWNADYCQLLKDVHVEDFPTSAATAADRAANQSDIVRFAMQQT